MSTHYLERGHTKIVLNGRYAQFIGGPYEPITFKLKALNKETEICTLIGCSIYSNRHPLYVSMSQLSHWYLLGIERSDHG